MQIGRGDIMQEPKISWIELNDLVKEEVQFEAWDGPCYTDSCDSNSGW